MSKDSKDDQLFFLTKSEKQKKWGKGPWVDEPDELIWTDKNTGYDLAIARNSLGNLCGYVCVNKNKFYPFKNGIKAVRKENIVNKTFNIKEIEKLYSPHGGVTYIESYLRLHNFSEVSGRYYWIGFDCAHWGDLVPGLISILNNSEFNQKHDTDFSTYRDVSYVKKQCELLAKEIKDSL